MKIKLSDPFWKVISLGTLAGMRTASAPAIVSHMLSHQPSKKLKRSFFSFMQSNNVALALKAFAIGELIVDKLPTAPNRTEPVGIAFRCLSGSLAGASIYKANNNNVLKGAILGAIIAFGSTYGSYYLRKAIVNNTIIPDPIVGAIEDTLVIGAGVGLTYLK